MKNRNKLPIEILLALSNLHAAIDRWDKWRYELYEAIGEVNSHAARKEQGLGWPPPETPPQPDVKAMA